MAITQMNVRIDADLKAAGDAVLARAGLTPTQFVRRAWEFAARNAANPEVVAKGFAGDDDPQELAERARKLALAEEGRRKVQRELLALGIKLDGSTSELSYKELRELYYEERLEGLA